MADQSLKDKTIRGTAWSALDNVVQYLVQFIVGIVLARILSPDDYGLIGIVTIFNAISTAIINGGFTNALIRKKVVTDDDYSTAFVVNLGVSIVLYLILFYCAPLIASFFGREELVLLTRVTSLGVIVGALALVQQTRLTKLLDFKTQTRITIISAVISGVVGIVMAFVGCGVWALVVQMLFNQILRTILLWMFNKWSPRLKFSKVSFHDLFGFGWKVMVVYIIDTVWKQLYQVVVGKFYSPATLGQYSRGKGYSELFSTNINNVIQRVTFPVLSDLQDNKERMLNAYRRIIKVTMFITAICMFSLGAVAEPLLYCLIGPKWHEAATYLPLMCIAGSLYPLHSINLNMLQVQGRSDLFLGLEIAKKTIAIIPLFVGAYVGIMPMLYVNLVTGLICYYLNAYFPGKLLGYTCWMQIRDVAPSYGIAVAISIPVWFLKYLPISNWIILPTQVLIGFLLFIILCKISKNTEYDEVKGMLKPLLMKFKR